jgi:hypothetical protein
LLVSRFSSEASNIVFGCHPERSEDLFLANHNSSFGLANAARPQDDNFTALLKNDD